MVVPRMLSLKRLVAAFSKCILELLAIDRDTEESSLLLMKKVLKKSMDGRARWLGLALIPEQMASCVLLIMYNFWCLLF